ncbi:unknown [Streptococcus phage C1]|uniref:Uncharacterized protein n=1 Tax=Streptococcus phage C1 TaxID=2907838 RepID=Q7Y3E2_BPSC1|nr:hypothetical protein C1p20 [Streptococcus phage C1]AAP42319.1 unknown [Streptococcus phage C1]
MNHTRTTHISVTETSIDTLRDIYAHEVATYGMENVKVVSFTMNNEGVTMVYDIIK